MKCRLSLVAFNLFALTAMGPAQEQPLVAANADIGVAEAEFFPQISLTSAAAVHFVETRFPQQYQFIFRFELESDRVEDRLRRRFDHYVGKTEIVIYSVLAVLLAVTAFLTIATAGQTLWIGLSHWTVAAHCR